LHWEAAEAARVEAARAASARAALATARRGDDSSWTCPGPVLPAGAYRCTPGLEYRVMRILSAEGEPRFECDTASGEGGVVRR